MPTAINRTLTNNLETTSLIAEPLASCHLGFLLELHQDSQTMKTVGGVRTKESTEKYLLTAFQHWNKFGFGLWAFRMKSSRMPIARGGLRHVDIEGRGEVEVAYTVHSSKWGQGYATEIAMLATSQAQIHGISRVVAFTSPENYASRRVMEKSGFRYERNFRHQEYGEMVLYGR